MSEKNVFDLTQPNKINRVEIVNFRGIKYWTEILSNENYNILGVNETYKTTKLQAIVWALNGKLIDNTSNIENVTPYDMEPDTETSVEIEFESGRIIKRTWQRKYKTNRDSGERSLDVPTQTIYIDNVKQSTLKQANQSILTELGLSAITDDIPKQIDLFMLLHVPRYLLNVEPKVMRELFEKIVGEPNLKEIISDYPKDVQDEFEKHSYKYDSIKSIHDKNIKETNAKINSLDNTVKTLEIEKANHVQVDIQPLKDNKNKLEQELLDLKVKSTKQSDELVKDVDLKVSETNLKRNELKQKFLSTKQQLLDKAKTLINGVKDKISNVETEIKTLEQTQVNMTKKISDNENIINMHTENVLRINRELQSLGQQFKEVNTPTFVTAPISKERFDIYVTDEMKHIRKEKLDNIKNRGLELKEELKEFDNKIIDLRQENRKTKENVDEIEPKVLSQKTNKLEFEKELNKIMIDEQAKIDKLTALYTENDNKYGVELETLLNERKSLLETNSAIDNSPKELIDKIQSEIHELNNQIISGSVTRDYKGEIEKHKKDITELRNGLIFSEKVVVFVKKIERDKLVALEKTIESLFGDISIKLFDFTQEGTIKPTFDIHVIDKQGFKTSIYQGLNNGSLDIAIIRLTNKIREFYKVRNTFVVIDEISSLDNQRKEKLYGLGQQVISSEAEKE